MARKVGGTCVVLAVLGSARSPGITSTRSADLGQVHPWWQHSRVGAPGKRIEEP